LKLGAQTFKIRKRAAHIPRGIFQKSVLLKDPKDQPPFFIRGISAGSKEEYWCSLALDKIQEREGYGWEYQVPIYGGRGVSGGLVIDFVVYTPVRVSWVSPMGKYWHTGKHEDRMQEINAAKKKGANLIAFFTDEIPTKEITHLFLKRKLGL
jgi:hypothetical protein